MGFTRSTTVTNVHSTLGDYPNVDDGLTPAQLKARFDSPATGLKSDINGLEGELEAETAAASLGADKITEADESDANIQAKLEKIYLDLQEVAIGEVPDNSITQAKIASDYDATLAKKNGTTQTNLNADMLDGYHATSFALKDGNVQTGLNAEKLGGSTLAQLITRISSYFSTGTTIVSKNSGQATSATISLGFVPCLMILANFNPTQHTKASLGIIFNNKMLVYEPDMDAGGYYYGIDVTISNSGTVTIPYNSHGLASGTYDYIAFKSSI